MSAFIVSDATIHQVLSYLNRAGARDCHLGIHFRSLGYSVTNSDDLQRLGQDLLDLNVLAVSTRYAHRGEPSIANTYRLRFVECSPVQAYKSAQCLRYQCSEDVAVDKPLYKALDAEVQGLAHHLIEHVSKLGYEEASWGAR